MSSSLQDQLIGLVQGDYLTLGIIAAIGYDYILTFPAEIEHIWMKPWTRVSTLFVFIRYCGLYNIMYNTISKIANFVSTSAFILFLGAADIIMMLRVWALHDRSKLILIGLSVLFFLEIISLVIATAVDNDPKNASVYVEQILNYKFCAVGDTSPIWVEISTAFQVTHGATMCVLAVIKPVQEVLQMYHQWKQWRINRYVKLLSQHGIVYFLAMFIYQLINMLSALGKIPSAGWLMFVLRIVQLVPIFTLAPRFILSMRDLYARDTERRRKEGIDSAFGLSSGRRTGTAMEFADEERSSVEENEPVAGPSQP